MSQILKGVFTILLVVFLANSRVEACIADTYTIQPGDTCSAISARYGISVDDLYNLNPFINRGSCNNLYPGQSVKVCPATNNVAYAFPSAVVGCIADSYTIQRGDTCTAISSRYGISLDELYQLNPFINKFICNNLYPGQSVKVCASRNSAVAPVAGTSGGCVADTYTIQFGDTCTTISTRYGISLDDFYKLNPFVIKFLCNNLFPGQTVKVCAKSSNSVPSSGGCISDTYTIQPGDICTTIGSRFGISLDDLYRLNPFINRFTCNNLFPGQTIKVCASTNSGATAGPVVVPTAAPAKTTTKLPTTTVTITKKPTTTVARDNYTPGKYCVKSHKVASSSETCNNIVKKYSIDYNSFITINEGIKCHTLRANDELCVRAVNQPLYKPVNCLLRFDISPSYQCSILSTIYKDFLKINPGINCDNLQYDQSVCIQAF